MTNQLVRNPSGDALKLEVEPEKEDSKLDTIWQIWEACRIYKMKWVMPRDVGRIVKHLSGEFYRPYYLSKHFRKLIKKAVIQHKAEEKEIPTTGNASTSKKGSYFGPLSPRTSEIQKSSEGEKTPSPRTPRPSTTIIINSLSHDSTTANHIASLSNGKASGGSDSAIGSNSRAFRRFVANYGRHLIANVRSIWSQAPVVKKEDFGVEASHKHRESLRSLSLYGHVNIVYQRSRSEMSSLKEKDSIDTADRSESNRSDLKDEHKSNGSEDKKDDTFSAMRKSSFAGRHRGHHRLRVGKLSAAERLRPITTEASRREVEEKESKRGHCLAQDKRTLYERIYSSNSQLVFHGSS
ncbi:unnamed protein product [Hymenolepis diminuta]|uniref:Uncharacterized protein n=1 Tax=Hymenolepis diminuta TaxID=6216 RepID=A0A0R3SYN4_HYMDI|nr:unnamed protein product [Hymenolepis diminuta]